MCLEGSLRAKTMTKAQRQAIATAAAKARWAQTPVMERSEPARKAVQARWAKAKTKKTSG